MVFSNAGTSAAQGASEMNEPAQWQKMLEGTPQGPAQQLHEPTERPAPAPVRPPPSIELAHSRFSARDRPEAALTPHGSLRIPELAVMDAPSLGRVESSVGSTVERVAGMILNQVAQIRQWSADAMAVVLRPDADTELFLRVVRTNGEWEAHLRLDRGDAAQINAHWAGLQNALGQQHIRLAPFRDNSHAAAPSGSSSGLDSDLSNPQPGSHGRPERASDEPPAWRESGANTRGRSSKKKPGQPSARGGWEFWA
jgi:hypothetical protein